jgi:hypothetical protein
MAGQAKYFIRAHVNMMEKIRVAGAEFGAVLSEPTHLYPLPSVFDARLLNPGAIWC